MPTSGTQRVSPACWLGLALALPFLSGHVFGDLFSVFILMLRILIARLQDPKHLYLIKFFFHSRHALLLVSLWAQQTPPNPGQKWNSWRLYFPVFICPAFSSQKLTLLKAKVCCQVCCEDFAKWIDSIVRFDSWQLGWDILCAELLSIFLGRDQIV